MKSPYFYALVTVGFSTAITFALQPFLQPTNLAMIYLVGVTIVAANFGRNASIMAALLSVACFDFFFIQPFFSFTVNDSQYLVMFAVMLFTSLVISTLASKLRREVDSSYQREKNMSVLYAMTKELVSSNSPGEWEVTCSTHMGAALGCELTIWLPDKEGELHLVFPADTPHGLKEETLAAWAFEHGEHAGLGTSTLPGSRGIYVPLIGSEGRIRGVFGVNPHDPSLAFPQEWLHLLEIFTGQAALALERMTMTDIAEKRKIEAEGEKLRSSLLSSVSHDLRTPLATIRGASGSYLMNEEKLAVETKRELVLSINDEAERLSKMVGNLLDVTRFEAAAIVLNRDFQDINELIGSSLLRVEKELKTHQVKIVTTDSLPLVWVDGLLIEQLLVNLLENAAKYTPSGSVITIEITARPQHLLVQLTDNGAGIPPGDEEKIFDKFYAGNQHGHIKGTGLGLAICRSIVIAHGGKIWAANRAGSGACFTFTLPIGTPMMELEEEHD